MNTNVKMKYETKIKYLDKIKGALFGSYIGDTMGATTEFMSKEAIEKTYGKVDSIVGGGWLNIKPGEPTDDTQMSLMVAEALMNSNKKNFEINLANAFVKWYDLIPKDVGGQTARAIAYYKGTEKFITEDSQALGNGSLMRNLPTALLGDSELCIKQGLLTHNNPVCSDILKQHCWLIQGILSDDNYSFNSEGLLNPTGCVINSWINAKHWANKPTFKECIIGAVNDGGDADTIACIAGGISGARFGFGAIPIKWLEKLDHNVSKTLNDFAWWLMERKYNG